MEPRTGKEYYLQNRKCVGFPEGSLVWFERCWDTARAEALKEAESAINKEIQNYLEYGREYIKGLTVARETISAILADKQEEI